MAGKAKKAESVITRKQEPKEKEDDKKIPLTGKGVVKRAAPKVGLLAKKGKKDSPQKTKGKKEAVRCRVIVKGGPRKKNEEVVVKRGKSAATASKKRKVEDEPSTSKTVKRGRSKVDQDEELVVKRSKNDGTSPKKTKKNSNDASTSEAKAGKKKEGKGRKTKAEDDQVPVVKTAKKPAKKPAPPRGLTAAEERLLAAIEEEERKSEKLREELEEKNERVKGLQVEEKEAKKEKAALEKMNKEMRAKLKALDKKLEKDEVDIRRAVARNTYHQEMIDLLDRRLVQLQAIQDQRNIQSAHRGREALTHRVLNRQLKRYLTALRTCITRMADGRSSPFIDRLLEIAQEDYSPTEEHRRIRDMMRSIGAGGMPVMGGRVMQVDLTDL